MAGLRAVVVLSFALGIATPAFAGTANEEPLPRIEGKLCPGVMGLPTESALTILDRVRSNADIVGIDLADPETCRPNMLVAFVRDGRTSVNVLMDAQPQLFDSLSVREKRALREESGPVRAWNLVQSYTRDGMWVSRREGLFEIPQASMWSAHSKIYTATRRDILSSDGGSRPEELTSADQQYLKALYSGIANLPGRAKEREIEVAVGG
jgi:hypothetical protein